MGGVTLQVSGRILTSVIGDQFFKRAGRAVMQPFLDTDDLITKFCAEFERLRKNFDSGVELDTALVLSRTVSTIDAIRACELPTAGSHLVMTCILQDATKYCQSSNRWTWTDTAAQLAFLIQDWM